MSSSKRYLVLLGLLAVLVAVVAVFFKNPSQNVSRDLLQMKTSAFEKASHKVNSDLIIGEKAHTGLLEFTNGVPVSNKMSDALLCADNIATVESVDLYMPDMGHGSEPPLVKKYTETIPAYMQEKAPENKGFGCLSVEKMQLFMPGLWQVRAFYNDGTVGLFDIHLKN